MCASLCQAAETLVGLGLWKVVVVVVGVESVHMEPKFVSPYSTYAVYQGCSPVVQYMEDSSLVAVHIAVPQLVAGVVDNRDWDARQICPTSETHHC